MKPPLSDLWNVPATITRNNFVNKSLSCWALNIAVGCTHGCAFCYVPEVSTRKMGGENGPLTRRGVADPDAEWGNYVFLRPWQEETFLRSLAAAENTPRAELNADGNRAVMLCTTTDPYMVIKHEDAATQRELNEQRRQNVRRALELIRDHSTLNVRILTRGPLAKLDFDLMRTFGKRLLFGMSLPTLDNKLARLYEPDAPSPSARLDTLKAAKAAGLHVYVAMAPTYPECGEDDLFETLNAITQLNPVTVFHEPINIRAENVARIAARAEELGVEFRSEVFASNEAWAAYSLKQLELVRSLSTITGLRHQLHLWPDAAMETWVRKWKVAESGPTADMQSAALAWIHEHWNRISEWPA